MAERFKTNKHHVIPSSRGGVNDDCNIAIIREDKQGILHQMFKNQVTIEKLQLIMSLDNKVLTPEFRRAVHEILSMPPDHVYKEEVFKARELMMRLNYYNNGF